MEQKTVSISTGMLIRECSLNPNLSIDLFHYFGLKNRENIHDIFKYKKFNDDFVDHLDCFNDGKNLIGMIRPSYDEFLYKLVILLNAEVRGPIRDDEALTKILLKRVEYLERVQSERELKNRFPLIYKDLMAGRKYYRDLKKMKEQEGYDEEAFASGEHYYYGCAMKYSLKNFAKTQAELYRRFITKRHELKEKQENMSFNAFISKNFNLDKFYMLVINEYLVKAEGSKDREEIKKYVNLVEQYLNSTRKKDFSITTDSGLRVDLESIQKRLKNLQRIIADDSSLVEWVLIPEGRDYTRAKREGTESETSEATLMNYEELERLRQKGERKRAFYETTPYLRKAIGLRKYNGYIAYIYENGEIVLDREFREEAPSTAMGDAIYNLKVADFETLSKYDKQVLMKHPRVGRLNHTPTWEKRVSQIIYREATPEEKVESHQLVKRLQQKNETI